MFELSLRSRLVAQLFANRNQAWAIISQRACSSTDFARCNSKALRAFAIIFLGHHNIVLVHRPDEQALSFLPLAPARDRASVPEAVAPFGLWRRIACEVINAGRQPVQPRSTFRQWLLKCIARVLFVIGELFAPPARGRNPSTTPIRQVRFYGVVRNADYLNT